MLISFKTVYNKTNFIINDSMYQLPNGNTVSIEILKFYISGIELFENSKTIWREKKSFHLYSADSSNKTISLTVPIKLNFDKIKFNLGIDSLTNVSGVMGGDLDPTKGMYWAWQSGYINFKIEGKSNLVSNPKKEFQFHLGGYLQPYYALQTTTLPITDKNKIDIVFDIVQFLSEIDFLKQNHIMSPSIKALEFSQLAIKCFKVK